MRRRARGRRLHVARAARSERGWTTRKRSRLAGALGSVAATMALLADHLKVIISAFYFELFGRDSHRR
jgi:hypothetical protein